MNQINMSSNNNNIMESSYDSYQAIKEGNHYFKLLKASFKKSPQGWEDLKGPRAPTPPTPPTPAPTPAPAPAPAPTHKKRKTIDDKRA